MLGAQASCLPERRRRDAALPLDVRNGYAFPTASIQSLVRGYASNRGAASRNVVSCGKAEPFRTSGGVAVQAQSE
jgi:hypothetical protein